MSQGTRASSSLQLPKLPYHMDDLITRLHQSKTSGDVLRAVQPFRDYESSLRQIYAQTPEAPAAKTDHLVSIFGPETEDALSVRARDLAAEDEKEKDRYLLPLHETLRKSKDSPATVKSLKEFRTNFNLFSESALVDLDWSNVVAAGSSVVTALLPVPEKYAESKKTLRKYYHEEFAPASDVDLFIHGLNDDQTIEKIKQIEAKIRDSILVETTTIRTKNTITIVSEYPTRHCQIVCRIYKSKSEIVTGFDVDCSSVLYDGQSVLATPRAIAAFMTQVNMIDLTRRSPSYENRLAKYSHRGFEAYWQDLDRSRIDPTIFERSFSRVLGLARLLVLEKLPKPADRDAYMEKRRSERGRPPVDIVQRYGPSKNIKDNQPEDVAEWVFEDDISSYHTFSVPYGPKYNAKKIEKLLFSKDLLLNAEWNKPKDRKTKLHRHPAFFGDVNDVVTDCCGFCPKPSTDEDFAAYEEESNHFISGSLKFLKDNPGRQAIGSFNPITTDDWTEMAYLGNTTRLCEAIVDGKVEGIKDWFAEPDGEVADVNRRDHTGRTPLQLAAMSSTPEVVQYLIEHGARITSRLYNGNTALHIAAYRGDVDIVKLLLDRSESNAEEEAKKEPSRKTAREQTWNAREGQEPKRRRTNALEGSEDAEMEDEGTESDSDSDDVEMVEVPTESGDEITDASFVKVKEESEDKGLTTEDEDVEADAFSLNDDKIVAWDIPTSPLHLAILNGRKDTVQCLVKNYSADVLRPIKLLRGYYKNEKVAILPLVVAMQLPEAEAVTMVRNLITAGATPAQADANSISGFQYAVQNGNWAIFDAMLQIDSTTIKKLLNFVYVSGSQHYPEVNTPLLAALNGRNYAMVEKLLSMGAEPHLDDHVIGKAFLRKFDSNHRSDNNYYAQRMLKATEQPIIRAAREGMIRTVTQLIEAGADVNSLTGDSLVKVRNPSQTWDVEEQALLDLVRAEIKRLQSQVDDLGQEQQPKKPKPFKADEEYIGHYPDGTYRSWRAKLELQNAKRLRKTQEQMFEQYLQQAQKDAERNKKKIIAKQCRIFKWNELEKLLVSKDAKTFGELHPQLKTPTPQEMSNVTQHTTDDKELEIKTSFKDETLAPKLIDAYTQLFEAAWTGDITTVKELCLKSTSGDNNPLLEVSASDCNGLNTLSIALFRGHYDLAKLVLDIAVVQYKPPINGDQYKYSLEPEYDDQSDSGDSDDVSGGAREDGPKVYKSHLIGDFATIDDLTKLADVVRSRKSPNTLISERGDLWMALTNGTNILEAMEELHSLDEDKKFIHGNFLHGDNCSWHSLRQAMELSPNCSLVRLAIVKNDLKMLKFILTAGNDLVTDTMNPENIRTFIVGRDDFDYALRLGRTEMISEIIRTTGHGFPLQALFRKSGTEIPVKPEYYQGLSVRGRKRKDWTDAARNKPVQNQAQNIDSPLLTCIRAGNIESVKYYLSSEVLTDYLKFTESQKWNPSIQALDKLPGGLKSLLVTWLEGRKHLALHAAVIAAYNFKDAELTLKYLLREMPELINTQADTGNTPLHTAYELGLLSVAKILMDAGADKHALNKSRENVLHALFKAMPNDSTLVEKYLNALGKDTANELLLQRSGGVNPGGLTPYAQFIMRNINSSHSYPSYEKDPEDIIIISKTLITRTHGKILNIMDGAGNYPLHNLITKCDIRHVQMMTAYDPTQLYRENAVGITPVEAASNTYLIDFIRNFEPGNRNSYQSRFQIDEEESAKDDRSRTDNDWDEELISPTESKGRSREWLMYRNALKLSEKYQGKRILVSALDANEVSKRLASNSSETKPHYGRYYHFSWSQDASRDEVNRWMEEHHQKLSRVKVAGGGPEGPWPSVGHE